MGWHISGGETYDITPPGKYNINCGLNPRKDFFTFFHLWWLASVTHHFSTRSKMFENMFPCYLQFSGSGSDGLEMKQKTGPNIMTITFLPPISGLSVLTGENTTIPIWKICSDNMIVSPEHGHTWLFEKKEFQISRYYLVRSDLIWDKFALKESESYIFVIDCDK